MMKDFSFLNDASTAEEIYPIVEYLHELLADKKYSDVDDFLMNAPITDFSLTSLCCIMRTTFSMQRHLDKWGYTLHKVSEELLLRGEDSAKHLRGLWGDVPEVEKLTGCTRQHISNMERKGIIRGHWFGGKKLYKRSELIRLIEGGVVGGD